MSPLFDDRQSLGRRFRAIASRSRYASVAITRAKIILRQAAFIFEQLQPRILFSGFGSNPNTPVDSPAPAIVIVGTGPNVAPTVTTPAAAFSAIVHGTTVNLSVLGADDNGQSNLTYLWATTGTPPAGVTFSSNNTNAAKNTVATFSRAGNYTFQVTITDSGGLTATSSVSVTVLQTATSIAITPSSAAVHVTQQLQLSATEFDQFNQAMTAQPTFTWALGAGSGSVSTAGLFTAPSSVGSTTVFASDGTIRGSTSLSIQNSAPVISSVAAASSSITTASTVNLSVAATDDAGASNLTYQWSVLSKPAGARSPTFSINNTNAASSTTATFYAAGVYQFEATVVDSSGLSTTSVVSVEIDQSFTTLVIAPPASMATSSTEQLSATALDQFGNAMASQAGLSWSANGGATISSSGLLTSPSSAGSITVQASYLGTQTQTTVSVVSSPAIIAAPKNVTGTSTTLTAVGMGSGLGYDIVWSVTSKPAGATNPTFSVNNSAGASTVATFSKAGTYTFQVQASLLLIFQSSATITVTVSQTLTSISVSPASPNLAEGAAQTFTASAFDQFGNAMAAAPTFHWAVTSGSGSINSTTGQYTAPLGATTASIAATSGNISGSTTVTVTNAAPTVATAASNSTATPIGPGQASLSVLGADDSGAANLTYTWSLTGTPPGAVEFTANGTNAARNTTAVVFTPGTYNFLVTITDAAGLSTTSSKSVTFGADPNQAPAITVPSAPQTNEGSALTFSSAGGNAITITNLNNSQEQVTLTATNGKLTLASTAGLTITTGTGTNDTTVTFSGNETRVNAVLDGLIFTPAANYFGSAGIQITGSVVGGNSATVNLPITVTQINLAPTVATAAQTSSNPVTGTTTALRALGADDAGESNLTYSWSVLSKPAGALSPSFSLNASNAAKNTVATFSAAGNYTLQVTITDSGGLSTTSSVSVTVDQTLTTISVTPGNASIQAGATQQFTAVGLDQFGQSMLVQPTLTWNNLPGAGSIDSSGLYTAPGSATSETITATSGSVQGSATITVVSNGTAVASPSVVTGTTTTLSVLGGLTSGVTYTWSTLVKPAGASVPTFDANNGTSAGISTVATFAQAGAYQFQVSIDNSGVITTQSVSVTVNQTVSTIAVTPNSTSLSENAHQQFSAVANDQFGNVMTAQPTFVWTVTTGAGVIDGSGLFTAPGSGGAGSATIHATVGSVSGTASITINNAAPTVATIAASTANPVTGTTTLLTVLGADDGGESNLNYQWIVTGTPPAAVNFSLNNSNAAKNTTAQFAKAGTYHFLVTISDAEGLTITSAVTVVVNQTLTTLTITPPAATVNQNSQQQFTAAAFDQFGNAMNVVPVMVWSVASGGGSINSTGLYTAPAAPGIASVTVSSGSVHHTAIITIANAAPTVAVPAAATITIVTATTTALSVLGADDAGESNLIYNWSTTGTNPAAVFFSGNNTNASKNVTATFTASGTYHFLATIIDAQGASVTSTVTVQVIPTFAAIMVTPTSSSLERAAGEQLSATAVDQFGAPIVSQPTFTWSTLGNVGTIDPTGLFTAPNAGIGNATIIATTGSISGSATISLLDQLSATVPATQTTTPNQSVIFSTGNLIFITDADANTQAVPLSLTLSATGGLLSLSQLNGLTLQSGTGSSDSAITFSGALASINSSLMGLKFTPDSGFSGDGTLTITINEVGVGQTAPAKTVDILVSQAAVTPTPPANTIVAPTTTGGGGGSILTGILNQTGDTTGGSTSDSSGSGGGTNGKSIFSQQQIIDTITVPSDSTVVVPVAPASPVVIPEPAHSTVPPAKTVAPAEAKPAPPSQVAHNLPTPAPMAIDKQVHVVPEQVFTFLAPQSPMLQSLDSMKTEMTSQKTVKITAGSATVVSVSASAAYLIWMIRGGSLLSSLLSIFPAWKTIDPLPVLESFEKSRKKRRGQTEDDESLESLVEKSNQKTESATKETLPEKTGKNP